MCRTANASLALLVAALAVAACSNVGRTVRKVTYPPDFTYLQHEDVESAMWRLAANVRELDLTLRDPNLAEPGKRERVLDVLERMQAASAELDAQGGASNHPLLDRKLPRLGADISAARVAATADPPSYVLAAAVSGACIYCHAARVPVEPATSSR